MAENYIITIDNTQFDGEDKETISLSTVGEYSFDGSGGVIRYRDSATTGFEGCETTLNITPASIELNRTGKNTSNLTLEKGKRHMCHYSTPYGDMSLGVYTNEIDNRLNEQGGEITFSYSLDINSSFFLKNDLKITVRERKNKNVLQSSNRSN